MVYERSGCMTKDREREKREREERERDPFLGQNASSDKTCWPCVSF
jgi:hypothetical protein